MLCNLCPHNCNADRVKDFGACQAPADFKIAHIQLHHWEEPCISGKNGSGTIFFSHCNLKCEYCQNYEISQLGAGKIILANKFFELCQKLTNQGAHNLNLITPTPYAHLLIKLLPQIKEKTGMAIIWNSNGYEKIETLKQLNGLVDVYLPDFKYTDNEMAFKYSQASNYFPTAFAAINEMIKQQPDIEIDEQGLIKKGVIIRHLVLPGQIEDSKKVLKAIKENFGKNVWVSLLAQYCPAYQALQYPEINRILNPDEYQGIKDYFLNLNFKGGFVQELDSASNKYTPTWQLDSLN